MATAHRAENVDDLLVLKNFLDTFAESPVPVVYPMHPRTKKRLRQNKMYAQIGKRRNVQVLPHLGYLDFLVLMKRSELIVTDSGGIQEEATAPCVRKPVLVIRLSTERPEAVEAGFAKVVGTDRHEILAAIGTALTRRKELPIISPFGNGKAAEKIVYVIHQDFFSV